MTLGTALFLVAIIYFCIVYPGFRKVAIIAAAAGALVFLCILLFPVMHSKLLFQAFHSKGRPPMEEAVAALASPPPPPPAPPSFRFAPAASLRVTDLQVTPAYGGHGGHQDRTAGYDLVARLQNTSSLPAARLSAELVGLDCRSRNQCEVTGREPITFRGVSLPPGESCQLTAVVTLQTIAPARYARRWRLEFAESNP
jgi:hypothetical protein